MRRFIVVLVSIVALLGAGVGVGVAQATPGQYVALGDSARPAR